MEPFWLKSGRMRWLSVATSFQFHMLWLTLPPKMLWKLELCRSELVTATLIIQLCICFSLSMISLRNSVTRPVSILTKINSNDCFGGSARVPDIIPSRYISRYELKRPRLPFKDQAVVLALTKEKFKFPLEGLPPTETCLNAVKLKYAKKDEVSLVIISYLNNMSCVV